jgi:hypothetical protein
LLPQQRKETKNNSKQMTITTKMETTKINRKTTAAKTIAVQQQQCSRALDPSILKVGMGGHLSDKL